MVIVSIPLHRLHPPHRLPSLWLSKVHQHSPPNFKTIIIIVIIIFTIKLCDLAVRWITRAAEFFKIFSTRRSATRTSCEFRACSGRHLLIADARRNSSSLEIIISLCFISLLFITFSFHFISFHFISFSFHFIFISFHFISIHYISIHFSHKCINEGMNEWVSQEWMNE